MVTDYVGDHSAFGVADEAQYVTRAALALHPVRLRSATLGQPLPAI